MYRIKNTNSKGDSSLLEGAYSQKKQAWLQALIEAAEEAQDILDCLETEEDKKTLRIHPQGKQVVIICDKYLDGERYESIYSVENVDLN